jgi:hypothetical protein
LEIRALSNEKWGNRRNKLQRAKGKAKKKLAGGVQTLRQSDAAAAQK